jgi:protein TonB
MAARPALLLIEGGAPPRVAVASPPDVRPRAPMAGARNPFPWRDRARVTFALVTAACLHLAVLVAGVHTWPTQEARAIGGSESETVIDGVSVVMVDSVSSAASVASLPQAADITASGATAEAVDSADKAPMVEDAATAVRSADIVALVETQSEPTAAVGDDMPAAHPADAAVNPMPTPPAPVDAAAPAAMVVAADSTPLADEHAALAEDPSLPTADPSTETIPAFPDTEMAANTDTVAMIADDTSATGIPDAPSAVAAEDAAVAAEDVTPPPSVPTATKPAPPKSPKPPPAPKTLPKVAQSGGASSRSSQASSASQAEQAAEGPLAGKAGAGGDSHDQNGSAETSSYQAALAAHLRQYRDFPAAARQQGMHGVARVTFTVSASGGLVSSRLTAGSGYAVLDQAALAMVQRAAPYPPIPKALGQRTMTVTVPVRFDLQ